MSDWIKKELVSTVKWMWVITFASILFYMVSPKYQALHKNNYRMNRVTGRVYSQALKSEPEYEYVEKPEAEDPFDCFKLTPKQHGFWFIENTSKPSN